MIVLPIIASWLLSLALVAALCRAARRGDTQQEAAPIAFLDAEAGPLLVTLQTPARPAGSAYPCNPIAQLGARVAEYSAAEPQEQPARPEQTRGDLALQPS